MDSAPLLLAGHSRGVAYSVVDRMTSRATSGVRYAVALIALLLMPVAVAATFVEEMRVADPSRANQQAARDNLTPPDGWAARSRIARNPPDARFGG